MMFRLLNNLVNESDLEVKQVAPKLCVKCTPEGVRLVQEITRRQV